MSASRPNFAIVGAARSGSTSVAEALRQHPDAFICQPKEPHYYAFAGQDIHFTGPGDDASMNRVVVTRQVDFLALFDGSEDRRARGDGSVSSLYYHDHAITSIRAVNPDMKIVIIVRHPVERAFSSYQYLRVRGLEPLDNFEDALAQEPDRRKANWHHLWHYTAMSRYATAVGHYVDAFGPEQVGIWFYDDLVTKPERCLAEVCRFLGLDPAQGAELSHVNVSGKPRSAGLQRLISWAGQHEPLRRGLKRVVPFGARERIRSANLKPNTLTEAHSSRLALGFREDYRRLEQIIEKPLPEWAGIV